MIISILATPFLASGTSAWNVNSFRRLFCKWRWRNNFLSLKVTRSLTQDWQRCIFLLFLHHRRHCIQTMACPMTSTQQGSSHICSLPFKVWSLVWAWHPHKLIWKRLHTYHKVTQKKHYHLPFFQSQPPIRVAPHYKNSFGYTCYATTQEKTLQQPPPSNCVNYAENSYQL